MQRVVKRLLTAGIALACLGCSGGGDDVERSAASFCQRYEERAESHDVDPRSAVPVERATVEEISDLADRAPDQALEDALRQIAEIQPEIAELMERSRAGDARQADFDPEAMTQYARAGRPVVDECHALCD